MILPVRNALITKAYGEPPPKGKTYFKGYHCGVDFISETGDLELLMVTPAKVIVSAFDAGGFGNYTVARTLDNLFDVIYGHESKRIVSTGQVLDEGSVIGIMGATGNVTGVHLHFEVRRVPWWPNREDVNAAEWLGIYNERGPARNKIPPESQEAYSVPVGPNITPFSGGFGWMESLEDRIIWHYSRHVYVCLWKDGRLTKTAYGVTTELKGEVK